MHGVLVCGCICECLVCVYTVLCREGSSDMHSEAGDMRAEKQV